MNSSQAAPEYSSPTLDDGLRLAAMARHCFVATFGTLYRREDLQPFLDTAFGSNGLLTDLADPAMDFRVARANGEIIAYAKVSPLNAPAIDPKQGALELRQLYVLAPWHGSGVATTLMEWALARARARHASEIYLTVFEHNLRAKRFYARHGFVDVGGCFFQVGTQIDDDRIWRRTIEP